MGFLNCHAELVSASHDLEIPKQVRNDKKCVAFTLAEVLITLTIIGVIAAITIPNLINKKFENEAVSRAKQMYAQTSNAWSKYQVEHSCNDLIDCFPTASSCDSFKNFIQESFKIKEYSYKTGSINSPKVNWLPNDTKQLDNTSAVDPYAVSNRYYSGCYYLLENGITMNVGGFYYNNNYTPYYAFLAISFDINGKKEPNQYGKDTFSFGILPQYSFLPGEITPEFVFHQSATSTYKGGHCYFTPYTGNTTTGKRYASCASNIPERHPLKYVLQNSKLPDLKKLAQ